MNTFDELVDDELLYIEGNYEMLCKIMFEHTKADIDARGDGFFDDQKFVGSFELTIDKEKNITFELY